MKKFHPIILRHILIIFALLLAFQTFVHLTDKDFPHAQNGALDLSHWDFSNEGRVTLSGEWEFVWNEFLSSKEFNSDTNLKSVDVRVPQIWNRYEIDGENLPSFGYATYHLKVKVPDTETPYSIRISSISTAYQCYLNDTLIAESGKIATSKDHSFPFYKPATAVFTPPSNEFDLTIQVSNHDFAWGGMWYDIDFGTEENIRQYESYWKYRDGFVIGILTIMAIYFFFFYLRMRYDYRAFSFMLMCLILIVRTSLYGDFLITQLFPGISFHLMVWLSFLTLIWFPIVLFRMVESDVKNPKYNLLGRFFLIYGGIMSALTALFEPSFYTLWTPAMDVMSAFAFLAAIANVFAAHLKRLPGANTLLLGSIIISFTGLHDILYQANIIDSQCGELLPLGLITFMLMFFVLITDRFSKTNREVQLLSDELTEKLKLEKDLTERLYGLDKLKDDFLNNTSNELRGPLNGIINITQSVLQGIGGKITPVQRQNLEVVQTSARKLHLLIDDLLDVSIMRSGGMRLVPVPLDIRTLTSNMFVVFRHLRKNEEIQLKNEIPVDFPMVLADEERLRQILNNLIGNSLKFTESGSITIGAAHGGGWARIYIEDTGIGISPEKLTQIFNAFEQVDGTVQRKYEGTGLGMYLTRQLVELHGGKIWITSRLGKGTCVSFTLQLSSDEPAEASMPLLSSKSKQEALAFFHFESDKNETPYHILAVDDDPSNLKALTNLLELASYQVRAINNGKDALRLLENGVSFDLIILDVMMPGLSGFEVLETLREKYNQLELPVLMLTSKSQFEDVSLCFKLGANDYLTKPFEADELLARVNSLAKLKRAVNQLITTEMSFLQAQIKPHFIHNALSVISSLSIKDPKSAKALILDLSDYLRGSFDLNTDDGMTTLSKELELVRAYLSIEQARFKERLQIHYHLMDEIDCTLPLLTIQPLVENAIRHGIMCRMEGGEIHITIAPESDRVRIEVRDNGVGIQPERIKQFFELKQNQRGVGIANIHRRLTAQYGDGLHIESKPNQGTVIYFYIPYQSGEELQNEDFSG